MDIDENILNELARNYECELTPRRNNSAEKPSILKSLNGSTSKVQFSPCSNVSEKFAERTGRLEVVLRQGLPKSSWTPVQSKSNLPSISFVLPISSTDGFQYMFQTPYDITTALSTFLDELSEFVIDESGEKVSSFVEVDFVESQDAVCVYGQIFSSDDGKLDATSIMLQGSRNISNGKTVHFDLNTLRTFSLFPGQFIALRGLNPNGRSFIPEQLLPLKLSQQPIVKLEQHMDSFDVVVAAGAFTTSDNLDYLPLQDLLKYVTDTQPQFLILNGPLIPVNHPFISKNLVTYSFDKMFLLIINEIILAPLAKCNTKVIIVSSSKDASHDPIYPTPPYRLTGQSRSCTEKVQFVSDPCLLRLGGVVFGLTATDVLFDLCREEISNAQTDRMSRMLEHLFSQRNFYPIYPPSEELNVDYTRFHDFASMPIRPHVLITPSNLRYFVKDISDVCCVNPGRLSKGESGGTFCRMSFQLQQLAAVNCKVGNCISSEILKI